MKKITALILMTALLCTLFAGSAFASSYEQLTESQKTALIEAGYPSNYKGSMQKWYEVIQDELDPFSYGSFTHYGVFVNFVGSMQNTSDPNTLSDFEYVARAAFDEVANESGSRITSLEGVWDCLTNRVANYNSVWSDYREAGEKWGLNSINPNYSEYWKSINVRKPIESASFSLEARQALVKSYAIAFDKFQMGANPVSNPHYKLTSMPDNYTFFDKSKLTNSIKYGVFWFHRHEDKM
ncbi:hypothetical protein ACR6HW_17300 [Fusibacter sp. JL298sf-3]